MQLMQFVKASLFPRRSLAAGVVLVGMVALLLSLAPRTGSVSLAENCENPPLTPTLNFWPVTYDDENTPLCHDFPAIDAAVDAASPQFSQSEADWNNGLTLQPGQDGVALLYIHNGAANNLGDQTLARNVRIITQTDTTTGTQHQIRTTFVGDNTNTVNSAFTIHTPANAHLEVYPNSGFMYDYTGALILDQQNLNLGNSTFTLGDLDACFEFSLFLSFKFKVVADQPQNTTLSIDKQVRNITQGTTYAQSTNAVQNDRVQYQVKVRNTGSTIARNVTLTDNGVAGISLEGGSVTVDGNNFFQGTVPGTLNLGDLQINQEKTITYTGRVNVTSGTLVNTATAVATNAPSVSDTATVIVNQPQNNTTLSIEKLVRNVSTGTGFADSAQARNGQEVQYQITVRNTGSVTAQNVTVNDTGTSGTSFIAGSIERVNVSLPGSIPGTISLGNLAVNESFTFTYRATVTANSGSFVNTATAQATNAPSVSDTARVNVETVQQQPGVLAINKLVKNDTLGGGFVNTTDARTGDRVTFQITVSNVGSTTINNVRVTDTLPNGLNLDSGSIRVDNFNAASIINASLGSLTSGQSKHITFSAQVVAVGPTTLRNVAVARGDNVNEVSDDAFVNVIVVNKPGQPNIVLSKRAFNDTKNVDATTVNASREDFITYSLVTTNNGAADAVNYVISDDLSQVLPFADMVETGGGTLNGQTITYPAVTIRPGETIVKTFKVRVKFSLDQNQSFQLRNTYGNTIVINIPGKTVFEAPKTGAAGTSAAVFAGLVTAGFAIARKYKTIINLIAA